MLDPTIILWGFVGAGIIVILAEIFLKNRILLNFIGLMGSIYFLLAGIVLLGIDSDNSLMTARPLFIIIGGFIMAAKYLDDIIHP